MYNVACGVQTAYKPISHISLRRALSIVLGLKNKFAEFNIILFIFIFNVKYPQSLQSLKVFDINLYVRY